MQDKKIAIIFGTRPEIIKLTPVIRECQKRNLPFFCIHTGQHYSFEMDAIFFDELSLPVPDYKLEIGTQLTAGHGEQVGLMLAQIEKILIKEKPFVVVVQGDTNTVLAGALSATKIPTPVYDQRIRVAHVEAGLRSYDRQMPEETNRVLVDHISDFLFAPTENKKKILLGEGIAEDKIFVVGNTIVDMVLQSSIVAKEKSNVLEKFNLKENSYILLTLHRQENVDSKETLLNIIEGVYRFAEQRNLPVVFPIHPRTEKMLHTFDILLPRIIQTVTPTGYLDFISLEINACLIMTDSGGLQEEACILQVPCVTLRNSTERPETIAVGANSIAGTNSDSILQNAHKMIGKNRDWENPFGDGKTAERIINTIIKNYEN
ncbi:UDP-N-acetylglucosamine 2-epimerase [Candidatus Uhrbacteria bacterium RIFOXYC2_FULL_47_19]|uniref:UDP-N-acetylglucosamine 2-epimerase n=1 Tax=Candidatus Uhrbacteria bacterium RIFOXYC2_FULL_47_19 TaxID=1802424 RepID=A0A1F7WEX6_9BACT|nr:MAG: UDP-N-acetylglucosamine 2-epimerase [Candidatus Uhrbacteria bacterium RIFOXYC2_FULL_47_19]HAB53994.1 UDP-N-acetylglucosamine 2-epimerase (non-hydrolyzing) [Ignavibacteriales bacterium]